MKLKEIEKDEDLMKQIGEIYHNKDLKWDIRMSLLIKLLGKSERSVRRNLVKLGFKEKIDSGIVESDQYKMAQEKIVNTNKKYHLISWAQNNTKADKDLIFGMEKYKEFLGVDKTEISIICGRYNNFNTLNDQKEDEYWDPILTEYLTASNTTLNSNIQLRGDIKIVPTNLSPLNGLEGLSNNESIVVGSPSLHMKTVPVVDPSKPKILMTTGACTIANYSQSLSGSKANFNHSMGFVVVEVKNNNIFFIRQVGYDKKTKQFTDLYFNINCKTGLVKRTTEMEGIVFGDLHIGEHDEVVLNKTLNVLMKNLRPNTVVCNDTMSSISINPHDSKDIFTSYKKEMEGTNDLKKEIHSVLDWLEVLNKEKYNVVIVKSNHDDMLDRWLKGNWQQQPTLKNSVAYMEYALLTLNGKAENGILPYLINQRFPNFKCLTQNESYKVGGFEVSQHGHTLANGSRTGALSQFKKLSTKIIFGHQHSPARNLGAICVPTNTKLRLSYTYGLSSWMQGSTIINKETLKAQTILFINGEFTTFE